MAGDGVPLDRAKVLQGLAGMRAEFKAQEARAASAVHQAAAVAADAVVASLQAAVRSGTWNVDDPCEPVVPLPEVPC